MGIFALCDEECLFPKATDKSLVEKLFAAQKVHPKFMKPDFKSASDFGVVHYAGRVSFNSYTMRHNACTYHNFGVNFCSRWVYLLSVMKNVGSQKPLIKVL